MAVVTKEKTLRFRVGQEADLKIREAASRTGVTVTDFVIKPALANAEDLLAQPEVVMLPPEQFHAMLAALSKPVTPIPELVELAKRPRRFART